MQFADLWFCLWAYVVRVSALNVARCFASSLVGVGGFSASRDGGSEGCFIHRRCSATIEVYDRYANSRTLCICRHSFSQRQGSVAARTAHQRLPSSLRIAACPRTTARDVFFPCDVLQSLCRVPSFGFPWPLWLLVYPTEIRVRRCHLNGVPSGLCGHAGQRVSGRERRSWR